MCVWRSINPGISVRRPRSITSAPAGGAPVPIETMRSLSTTITGFVITLPDASIALPARIALVAANAFDASASHSKEARTEPQPRKHERHEGSTKKTSHVLLRVDSSYFRVFVVRVRLLTTHTSRVLLETVLRSR